MRLFYEWGVLKKILFAIGGYNFAFKGINDFYIAKFENKSCKTYNK